MTNIYIYIYIYVYSISDIKHTFIDKYSKLYIFINNGKK